MTGPSHPRDPAGTAPPGALLRTAVPGDAAALLRLKQRLDDETSFMLFEPGERDASAEALASQLDAIVRSPNSVLIIAEIGGEPVGYVELMGGTHRRSRTTAQVVLGVLATASGRGIGGGLLRQARSWASRHGLHRLELTVMAHNARAIALYERSGFAVEGRRTECLIVDGQYVDELFMAAVIEPAIAGGVARCPR